MDTQTKRKALRMLSNGMYVLTSRSGESYGVATVTWVSQASFKPPLLMMAVRRDSNVYRCLAESGVVHFTCWPLTNRKWRENSSLQPILLRAC